MRCDRLDPDRLTSLASGEVPWWGAWLLRRHLRACPDCRARWEQTQALWSGLQALASAPAPDALRSRVFAGLPPVTPPPRRQTRTITVGGVTMNRRTFAITSAALLLVVTGALAARLMTFRPSSGFTDENGRLWTITGQVNGQVQVFNPHGQLVGSRSDGQGTLAGSDIEVSVAEKQYQFHGPDRREVRDPGGRLIGTIVLSPYSQRQFLKATGWPRMPHSVAEMWQWERQRQSQDDAKLVRGVHAEPASISGFDHPLRVSWTMRGFGTVSIFSAAGKQNAQAATLDKAMTPTLRRLLPPDMVPTAREAQSPDFDLTVANKTTRETGYGEHLIRDATGKTLLILKADSPARLAPAQ